MADKFELSEEVFEGLSPRGREIAQYFIEHPKVLKKELAEKFHVSQSRISQILNSNRFFRALNLMSSNKLRRAVPRATDTLIDSLESKSEDIKFRTAKTILENEGILGPQQVELKVNDMRNKTPEELQAILSQAKEIPPQSVIEAEVIKDE